MLNAIGLANPGADAEVNLLIEARRKLEPLGVPLIASLFAGTAPQFGEVAATLAQAQPDLIEINISCPNVGSEFGEPFAGNADSAVEVTAAVKRRLRGTDIPLIVKLAPNVPSIARIAVAVVEAGADALCVINTMPGMVIEIESGQPVLANRSGGLSGPAIKPIAIKCVYDVHQACPDVPIIGTGGITCGNDAIEMVMAGATLVGIGTAIYYRGSGAIEEIKREMATWLDAHGIEDLAAIRGCAHCEPKYDLEPTGAPVPAAH